MLRMNRTNGGQARTLEEEIEKTAKKLKVKWHPDRNKDPKAEGMFQKISQAYDVLKEPRRRAVYDKFGYSGEEWEKQEAHYRAQGF